MQMAMILLRLVLLALVWSATYGVAGGAAAKEETKPAK